MRWKIISAFALIMVFQLGFVHATSPESQYFSPLLGDFGNLFENLGTSNVTDVAIWLSNVTNQTYQTLLLYGANESLLSMASDFKALGDCSYSLVSANEAFLEYYNAGDYDAARRELVIMKDSYSSCVVALGGISKYLNVSQVEDALINVEKLISLYSSWLEKLKVTGEFRVYASALNPYVFENVTFYGYASNVSSVVLVVNGTPFGLNVTNGTFQFVYSFFKPGNYSIFAEARGKKSNVLTISVLKAPTKILAREVFGNEIAVKGVLLDYFGRPVPNATIYVRAFGLSYSNVTNSSGSFIVHLGTLAAPLNVTVSFPGDEVYNGSSLVLSLFPAKKKPVIVIKGPKSVAEGKPLQLRGLVSGVRGRIPLTVYVDGKPVESLKAGGNFTVALFLNKGTHTVYVAFKGSETLLPAVSNVLTVDVVAVSPWMRIGLFVLLLIIAGVLYRLFNRRPQSEVSARGSGKLPSDFLSFKGALTFKEAFRVLYSFLRKLLSLPPSTTPRELLEIFKDSSFFLDLREVVVAHEKLVYAKKRVSGLSELVRRISHIIIRAVVGEEL